MILLIIINLGSIEYHGSLRFHFLMEGNKEKDELVVKDIFVQQAKKKGKTPFGKKKIK